MKFNYLLIYISILFSLSCSSNDQATLTIAAGGTGHEIQILRKHLNQFEKLHPGLKVKMLQLPPSSSQQHDVFVTYLSSQDTTIDVLNLDLIWISEFAAAGWIMPLDHYWSLNDQQDFLKGTLQSATYNNELYAVPWFTSCGILYSRKDILDRYGLDVPHSWSELVHAVKTIKKSEPHWMGFIWQGAQYEGLVCNYYEAFWSLKTIEKTLVRMREALGEGVSPQSILLFKEEDVRRLFTDGKALFMRNWPYAWGLLEKSPLKGKVSMSAIPWNDMEKPSYSTLGGWNLALNRFSQHPDLAWELIAFLSAKEQMLEKCLLTNEFPTRISLLKDAGENNPYWDNIFDILMNARSRPQTPFYSDWSLILQLEVSKTLSQKNTDIKKTTHRLKQQYKHFQQLEKKET